MDAPSLSTSINVEKQEVKLVSGHFTTHVLLRDSARTSQPEKSQLRLL